MVVGAIVVLWGAAITVVAGAAGMLVEAGGVISEDEPGVEFSGITADVAGGTVWLGLVLAVGFTVDSVGLGFVTVGFAVELVGLAVEVVGFAVEVVGLAVELVGFAVEFATNSNTASNSEFELAFIPLAYPFQPLKT